MSVANIIGLNPVTKKYMPCDSGPSPETERAAAEERRILTLLACAHCRYLHLSKLPIPEYAVDWWNQHEAEDEKRRQEENSKKVIQGIRETIIKNLSPAEIDYLKKSL